MNQKWRGGDIAKGPGGGHKINILKNALKEYKDEQNTVVMFTDRCVILFYAPGFLLPYPRYFIAHCYGNTSYTGRTQGVDRIYSLVLEL